MRIECIDEHGQDEDSQDNSMTSQQQAITLITWTTQVQTEVCYWGQTGTRDRSR